MKKLLKFILPGAMLSGIQTASVYFANTKPVIDISWPLVFIGLWLGYTIMFVLIEVVLGKK